MLVPTPSSVQLDGTAATTFSEVRVTLPSSAGPVLRNAAVRLTQRLTALRSAHRTASRDASPPAAALTVRVACSCAHGSGLALGADERSSIRLSADSAEVRATTEVGVLRAFATLTQLARPATGGFTLPAGEINDAPRFPWRGLMIDVARHFQSIAALERQIDAMELTKLNVLHLHLSDNEGFRLESRRFPRLHAVASHGQYYTQAEVRALVQYAAARGVRVVPEIDVPGHSRALVEAYPALASPNAAPRTTVIDPTREGTYTFLTRLFTEIAGLFPDPYLHVGADEVNAALWTGDPAIQRFMRARGLRDAHALQAHFTRRLHTIVQRLGKTMIGWDEILAPDLPSAVVVQSWTSSRATALAAQQGHRVIVSAGYYLDWLTASDTLHRIDPLDARAVGLTRQDRAMLRGHRLESLIGERFERDSLAALTERDAAKVLGGEAAMWTELVTEEKLDATIWPRMGAVADRLWSPRTAVTAPLDERLAALSTTLEAIGVRHRTSPVQMRRRLAPTAGDALDVLAEALEPVKFYGHNHRARGQRDAAQSFTELADALTPESATAARFNRLARAWRPNARASTAELRALLVGWRDQAAAMDSLTTRVPALVDAREVSRDLAQLAAGALEAMEHLSRGSRPNAEWRARLQPVIDRQGAYAQASRNFVVSFIAPQPPGDLLLAVLPGLRELIALADVR
ncbi:MAG: beta-N-acetylhexosaminidase [Gemmatimonadaceae bacterium]|nr:beta-N-acetylhexosaminidase [Gemmatimonadaceae bacterium]